jgi:type II secretory pathway pseudopilin PulG
VSVLEIIIAVLVVLIVVLFAGGLIANARHRRTLEARLRQEIAGANEALADARAADRGWDLPTMEAAARRSPPSTRARSRPPSTSSRSSTGRAPTRTSRSSASRAPAATSGSRSGGATAGG